MVSPLLLLALASLPSTPVPPEEGEIPELPSLRVKDILSGDAPRPGAGQRVRIYALRQGEWVRTEWSDATAVKWERLLADDRVEVATAGEEPP